MILIYFLALTSFIVQPCGIGNKGVELVEVMCARTKCRTKHVFWWERFGINY